MKWPVYLSLVMCAAAGAADPPATPRAAPGPATTATSPAAAPASPAPAVRKPLDLRIGDIRNYMTPDEFRALLTGREEERNTVVVEANVPLVPMKSELDVPGGIIAPFWAIAHPTKAWRIFLPDVAAKEAPPPEQKIPPPIFRWGP